MPVETLTGAGPMAGALVADFSRVLAGPLASMFLGDLGATVIKVERPDVGDDARAWGPPWMGSTSTYYASVNRNKRSVCLDVSSPDDQLLAQELANRADVVVENFRPGKLTEYGLGAEQVLERNPRSVYCSISGFGSGAGAGLLGYDFLVQAVGGLMSITGQEGGEPTRVGVALVDVLTGMHATIGVLAALRHRDATGKGQHVEVNLLSSLLSSLINQGSGYINGAPVPKMFGNQHPSIAPYETVQAADGPLALAVGNDSQFRALVTALGRPLLAADERFATNAARVTHRSELVPELEAALRDDSAVNWSSKLQAAGVPCGPVQDIAAAIELASQLGLEPVIRSDSGTATLASPLRLPASPVSYVREPPELGADTAEVVTWLLDEHAQALPPASPNPGR